MLESLRHQVYLPAVFIALGVVLVLGALGLWLVHKSTGRSIREMLTLLAAAVVLISLMMVPIAIFHKQMDSPDRDTRRIMNFLMHWGTVLVAFAVWWVFNRLWKPRRKVHSRRQIPNDHEPTA